MLTHVGFFLCFGNIGDVPNAIPRDGDHEISWLCPSPLPFCTPRWLHTLKVREVESLVTDVLRAQKNRPCVTVILCPPSRSAGDKLSKLPKSPGLSPFHQTTQAIHQICALELHDRCSCFKVVSFHLNHCPEDLGDAALLVERWEGEPLVLECSPVDGGRERPNGNLDGPAHEPVAHHQERQEFRQH